MPSPSEFMSVVFHKEGSISYKLVGDAWVKRVWALPFELGYALRCSYFGEDCKQHMTKFRWDLRSNSLWGPWYYMAPDHLAGRVDSSD